MFTVFLLFLIPPFLALFAMKYDWNSLAVYMISSCIVSIILGIHQGGWLGLLVFMLSYMVQFLIYLMGQLDSPSS